VPGTRITATWTSSSNSKTHDLIAFAIVDNHDISGLVSYIMIGAGLKSGSFSVIMPNNPGVSYHFGYLPGSGPSIYSTPILCVAPTTENLA